MISYLNDLEQPVIQLVQADYDNCVEIIEKIYEVGKQVNLRNSKFEMTKEEAYEVNFCGALGEQAIAHYLDFDYSYLGYDPKRSDVLGYEVRATYYSSGRLLTHPIEQRANDIGGDKAGRYVLVTIEQHTLKATIRGYSPLTRCNERAGNWDAGLRWPCFAMPQWQLIPIDMLPATDELINHQTRKKNQWALA